jgi:hypothetical protein
MELIISIIAVAIIVYFGYEFFLNKDKADGSHPLDSVTTRTEPTIEPIVVKEATQAPVEPVVHFIDDAMATVVTPTIEENDMATKKSAPAPVKEAAPAPVKEAAPAPAKETVKAPAKKAAAPAKKPKK